MRSKRFIDLLYTEETHRDEMENNGTCEKWTRGNKRKKNIYIYIVVKFRFSDELDEKMEKERKGRKKEKMHCAITHTLYRNNIHSAYFSGYYYCYCHR